VLFLLRDDLVLDFRVKRGRDDLLVDQFVLGLVRTVLDDLCAIRLADPGYTSSCSALAELMSIKSLEGSTLVAACAAALRSGFVEGLVWV
jgi:hypothetical protein